MLNQIAHYFDNLIFFYTSIYENSELKVLKNIKVFSEISRNWPNDLLGANIYKALESSW